MSDTIIKVENVSKEYRLGAIGGGTLNGDLQSLWARVRGKEDPNSKIGTKTIYTKNEKFFALDNISFEVNQSDTLGIIGHNGAGKSTLLKLLSRVTAPSKGNIKYNGRITSMLEVGTGFHPELTGRENVYLNGAILGMPRTETSKKFDEIVEFAEMEQFIDTPVKRYSSGMYVKLAFSVAAHLDSEILIMDEVLAVGDMKFQEKCLRKMSNVADKQGRTILYVSHNMNTIQELCNRCIILDHGKLVYYGAVDTAVQRYMNLSENLSIENNLEYIEREKMSILVQRAKMLQIAFLEKNNIYFSYNEPMKICLKWKAFEDADDLFIRFTFKYVDSTPLGMSTTISPIAIKAGEVIESNLEIDLSFFASGKYYASACIYKQNILNGDDLYDYIGKVITFEIHNDGVNTNKLSCGNRHKYWGHVVLPHIKLI